MVGVWAANSTSVILWRALVVMFLCYAVGRITGAIMAGVVEQDIEHHRKTHPIPSDEVDGQMGEAVSQPSTRRRAA